MVFESLVVDLINKYLGDFVENLDKSQLKLGIWGGDVVLKELDLKESALDDLDLPVKIKAGHVGNLTLKIPWKNLYTEPVVASIDGLYALAVPNVGIKYNAEREEKDKQDSKQKKLRALEEAKKLEAEKDKPKEKKKDSFAEKFATQVIKNLQVEVRNIHVRFEDKYTNPNNPFSIGVTLQELLFKTTDENWKPCIIKEAVSQIYKLVKLEALAVYWNSSSDLYDGLPKTEILKNLKGAMVEEAKPDFKYLVAPISSVAHLRLNTKPGETEYKIPKIFLTIIFDNISVGLAKVQYNDVLQMLEGFERVRLMGLYKKFKPAVALKGNLKTWWHFAYKCILEETVRRRRKMWSWDYLKSHRDAKRAYKEAFIQKLENKKVSADLQKKLDEGEKFLDVFNITIMRQQAEVEAAKRGAKRAKDKAEAGWFGGWFGGGKKKEESKEKDGKAIQDQFYEQFTLEEKNKLYDAIGYQENEADLTLPKEFVAIRIVTKLNKLSFMLTDEAKKDPQIMNLQVKDVFASVGQRPAANAVRVEAKLDKFNLLGTQQGDFVPRMVTSQTQSEAGQQALSLLDVAFETNPLDGLADTRVKVGARPLQIVYDAITVNQLAEFFKPPKDIQLKQLSEAAMSKFEEVKEQSATGLQHAIDQKKYTEIAVDLQSSFVVVPHGGLLRKQKDVSKLVLDLGNFKISTERSQTVDVKQASLEEVMASAYDKFHMKLDHIQLLMAHSGEDWQRARKLGDSPMHILRPISINILLQKCMFDKDPRMAKMKVRGELPLLRLDMSDHRLQEILHLVQSIPLPEGAPPEPEEVITAGPSTLPSVDVTESRLAEKAQSLIDDDGKKEPGRNPLVKSQSSEFVNATDMELAFVIKEININIAQRSNNIDIPLLKLVVENLGTELCMRTFDMSAKAYLGGVYLQFLKIKVSDELATQLGSHVYQVTEAGPLINLVNTPVTQEQDFKLLSVDYLQAKPDGPEFATVYKKTEKSINVEFAGLELLLHQEAILDLLVFAQSLQPPETKPSTPQLEPKDSKTEEEEKEKVVRTPAKTKPKDPDIIDLSLKARLKMFSVAVCTQDRLITDIRIKGIEAGVTLKTDKTLVTTVLKDISVQDPSPLTFYPKILEIQGSEVLALDLALYNKNTEGASYEDMSKVDMKVKVTLGRIKVTFLNKFVNDLLGFLNNFQAAQAKLKEAGDAMAEMSKDAVANLQETASRLSLAVEMKAPIILVPQNSRSYTVLIVDLGHLAVGNKFEMPGKRSANGIPAVLEKMNVTLTDLKVSRAEVDASQFVKAEVEVLRPVNIKVDLCRNMAANWFHDVPDMDISGTLQAINVTLSQGDFTTMMKVLNENLTEGQTPVAPDTPAIEPGVEEAMITPSKTGGVESVPGVTTGAQAVTQQPWCKLKFNFCINSLCATLYSGDSKLTSGLCMRDAAKALGSFELQLMALTGQMMSNTDMTVKVILKDTIMDDLRAEKKSGICKMMERSKRVTTISEDVNMIDVSFTQETGDKKIAVHMSSLYLCVCLDFLMSLADFFVKGLPAKPDNALPPPPPTDDQAAPATPQKPADAPAPPPQGDTDITVTIERPEIIMIEDQSNFGSNALQLDMELMFRMRQTPETMDMSAAIKNLGIVSCKYNDRQAGSQILTPCDISFYSKAPTGQGAHMDVSTTDLILNISPATIRTMSGIAGGLSKQGETEEEEEAVPADLWTVKKLSECDFWFLKTADKKKKSEVDTPPLDVATTDGDILEERGEQMIVKVPNIVLKIEGGVGNRTVPLLVTEMAFQGEVRDWSGKLGVESSLKLEVAYFNEKLAVWEPLLEPVLDQGKFRPWELQLEVAKNDDIELGPEDEEETDVVKMPPPKMSINVRSSDALQMTMTKSCLESLTNLGKAFGDAYALVEPTKKAGEVMSPYLIRNQTGMDILLKLDNTFVPAESQMPPKASNGKIMLPFGDQLALQDRVGPKLKRQASIIKAAAESEEKKILFQVEEFSSTRDITIKRVEKRLFHFKHKTDDMWAIVSDVSSEAGQKTLTFRSSVQVTNHLAMPVEVFYKDNQKGTTPITTVKPDETFSLPLNSIYTSTGAFMYRLCADGCFGMSDEVSWKGAENLGTKQLMCKGEQGQQPYYFKIRASTEDVYYEAGDQQSAKTTTFHLHPTVILHNQLPYKVKVMVEGTADALELEAGSNIPLDHACVGKSNLEITIPDYMKAEWSGRRCLEVDIPELSMWTFEAFQGGKKTTMDLGLHYKKGVGALDVSIYSPYWMVNKTDINLIYKAGDDEPVEHPTYLEDIVMFSFKKNSFFGKKKDQEGTPEKDKKKEAKQQQKQHKVKEWRQGGKATLKVGEGDWSDKFSLDTVGSSGTVQSKTKTRTWEVGVSIVLACEGLTKVVTFTPYYVLVNKSKYPMMCQEIADTSSQVEVPAKGCTGVWPVQTGKELVMQAQIKDSSVWTAHFRFNKPNNILLPLANQYGGIDVDCVVTESAMVTTLTHYKNGMAPVQIINHTDKCKVQYYQSGNKQSVQKMEPQTAGLYTWENSLGKHELLWTCGEKKEQKNDLSQDGIGEFFHDSDTKVYWVSFLNGMQRVLLFTHDLALATIAQEAGELERIEQEITLNIQGMGLSLVNNSKQQEVAFLGITSSGIIWEEKKKRYKAFGLKTCQALENAFQKFELELAHGHTPPDKMHFDKMEVNFHEMLMTKPNKRMIRRSFQDGIWIQYKTSPHQVQFHAKINRVQLDNQVHGAVFQTVLSPMPPPKSVAADSVPKPFTEISMMMRKHEHSDISQIKYFKVLIQEMQVKVDQGFLNNLLELFSADQELTIQQQREAYDADLGRTRNDLVTTMGLSMASEQKMFYDYLHLSPIKIHLSFSLQGGGGDNNGKPTQIKANVVNVFLQSVGVVLTDIQDVVFKLGYFERQHNFYNNNQLVGEMSMHYAGQAIKQMYVLVLGLDVLGNPFGLLRGVAEGIEDLFYEPYQGAIQGPEEFAEGLALGVRSLFGHAVGGAAGAVSRITGTVGKGIAALTLDDDYQRKRREAMNKRPANVGEGFARGGKGLVMGVFDGVTGIVRKPVEGAKKEGVEGFFKGVGKGLIGVVTRPTSGVIDFASSSFEGIKRIAENTTEIKRLRPPRRFHKDRIVRPYNVQEAEGTAILMDTEKGRFYTTDDYVAHLVITKDGRNVFLVTNKRVVFASRGEIFGQWNCEFTYVWAELKEKPKASAKGMELVLKEKEKKFLFGSASSKKEIHIADKKTAEWLIGKVSDAMDLAN